MGSIEHDMSIYEAEQDRAVVRDDYAVANRGRFMSEAITEEVEKDLALDLSAAMDQLADGKYHSGAITRAYLSRDDTELGRLVRMMVQPVIEEFAVSRAERMAAEEFDRFENQHRVKE